MAKTGKNGQATPQAEAGEARLSVEQLNAIDLLMSGRTDQEVGDAIGRRRQTVNQWRLYHPAFKSELNTRRAAVWEGCNDRLRGLIPKALDVLEQALRSEADAFRAACTILKTVALPVATFDRRDEDAIIADAVQSESVHMYDHLSLHADPDEVRAKMLAKANAPEEGARGEEAT